MRTTIFLSKIWVAALYVFTVENQLMGVTLGLCGTWICVWEWMARNASTIIALAALFVSLIVGAFAVWQVFVTRRHNRLSMRPVLDMHIDATFQPTGTGYTPVPGYGEASFLIRNTGVGPAMIDAYDVTVDGDHVPTNRAEPQQAKLRELLNRNMSIRVFTFSGQYSIRPNADVALLRLGTQCTSETEWGGVIEILKRCQIEIEYHSLYGERFKFRSHPTAL